MTYYLLM